MKRFRPIGLYVGLALAILIVLFDSRSTTSAQQFDKLEGNLLKADIPELTKANVDLPKPESYLPRVKLKIRDVTQLGLPEKTSQFIGEVSADSGLEFSLASKVPDSQPVPPLDSKAARPKGSGKRSGRTPSAAPASGSAGASDAKGPISVPVPAPLPRASFATLDGLLTNNALNFPLGGRFKRREVTVKLEQLGKFDGYYLLKFSVANNGAEEFYISKVMLTVNQTPIPTREIAMPYSCRSNEVIYGIVKFAHSDVAAKNVGFVLTESGMDAARYEIRRIEYAF